MGAGGLPGSTNPASCTNTVVTPTSGPIPRQERGKRRRPSGIVKKHR